MLRNFKLFFLLLILFFGCTKKNEVIGFYEEVKNETPHIELKRFTETNLDSSGNILKMFYPQMKIKFDNLDNISFLKTTLRSKLSKDDSIIVNFLTIGFHNYCNNISYSPIKIYKSYYSINEYIWDSTYNEILKENIEIAYKNDSLFSVGDTIFATLPMDSIYSYIDEHEYFSVFYSSLTPNEYSFKYTFDFCGKIVGKKINSYPIKFYTDDLVFNIELIEINNSKVKYGQEIVSPGDTIEFYVSDYAKILDNCK